MTRNIEAVVLDLEGVYFEGVRSFNRVLASYGASDRDIKKLYLRGTYMKLYKKGIINGRSFWEHIIEMLHLPATQDELLEKLVNGYKQNEALADWITSLRNDGIRTGACSNTFPERIKLLNERFHFRQNFDVIVTSYEEHILKPNEGIFLRLCERLSLPPQKILMTDDKGDNIKALGKLGFNAVLYKDVQSLQGAYAVLQSRNASGEEW